MEQSGKILIDRRNNVEDHADAGWTHDDWRDKGFAEDS